nr:hypothetical protein [Tanacetum cinerariifolium]GFA13913.1 hypothetical protein [Tanacetum cinerariifolium]
MLEKDLYDSWKSRMELYKQNREHGRMILESVEHGPLIWLTVKENGVIRTKKYAELSAAEKIQADCDMKATNIILQGTSLTKQERECKLYDAFDKFTHVKEESLHMHYLRFNQLINDMNIYKMKMEQFQVNTKFLNSLPPAWSKFVTDMTPPQFNTYQSFYNNPQLQQQFSPSQHGSIQPNQHYSSHYPSQTQFNHSSILRSHTFQSQMNHQTSNVPQVISQVAYQSPQAPTQLMTGSPFVDSGFAVPVFSLGDDPIAYQSPQAPTQLMTGLPFIDSGFVVPVFSPGDDPISCFNKAMAFLTAVASSRFPSTNNQLRTSSNIKNKPLFKTTGLQCNKFRGDKGKIILVLRIRAMLLVQGKILQVDRQDLLNATTTKKAGQILDKEQLAFLADPGILADQAQKIIPHNASFQTEDLDTYDSNCDDLSTAQAVLMANISNYGSDVILEVPNSETYLNDMDNQSVHALQDFEQLQVMDFIDNEISSDSNIIPYS